MRKKFKDKYNKGITIVEVVVVISIFVLISSLLIFNYGQFRTSMSIHNLVDDIALTIRRAQSYAIGVKGLNEDFLGGYGVHLSVGPFVEGQEHKGSNKSIVLFAERGSQNFLYDYGQYDGCGSPKSNNECLEILKIMSPDVITAINLYGSNDNRLTSGGVTSSQALDIVFYRPNPEPVFCLRSNSPSASCNENLKNQTVYAVIEVSNNTGGVLVTKKIRVSNSGQISVSD